MKKEGFAKRLIAFCSVFVMAFLLSISALAAESSGLVYGENGTITRAQWLHDLVTVFGLTSEDEELPDHYYQDLTSDKEYYRDMMVAVEYGIIDIPSGSDVYPEKPVTREFAVSTLNYCLGIRSEEENPAESFYDYEDIPDELREDAQVAIDRSWLELQNGNFDLNADVTPAEAKTMLDDANTIGVSVTVNEDYNNSFTFKEGVIEVPEGTAYEIGENTVTIYDPDVTINPDDTFVIYDNGLPQIYKAVSVEDTDNGRVITTEISEDMNELQSADAEGIIEADLADIVPADGMEVTYFTGGTEAESYTDGVPYKDSRLAGNHKVNAATVSGEVPLGKGASVHVTCTITNTTIKYKVDTWNHEVYVSAKGDMTVTATIKGDYNEASGTPKMVDLGGMDAGAIGRIRLYARVSVSGSAAVTYKAAYEIGVQHTDSTGTRCIKSFRKKEFSSQVEMDMCLGEGIEARFNILFASGSVSAETGMRATYKEHTYNDGEKPNKCATYQSWMYAKAEAALTLDYGLGKKTFRETKEVYNAKNSPVRYVAHCEDGAHVPYCTRGADDDSWYVREFRGIYSSIGDGYGYNEGGEYVPVYIYKTYQNDNKETVAEVTGYTGRTYALSIPETIDDYKVEKIGSRAFEGRSDICTVVIPDTVKSIGTHAFGDCTNLRSVQLSANLQTMDAYAFNNCDQLTSIQIPKSLEKTVIVNYYGPFYGCDNLKHVNFEEGTKTVAQGLFANCPGLEEIVIPDTVTELGRNAFEKCTSLKKVTIGNSVTTLGSYVFAGCGKISEVVIPDSVTTIGSHAFGDCTNLGSAQLSSSLQTMEAYAFENCNRLTSIRIPKSLEETVIVNHYGPFYGCENLKEVTFEEGIKTIAQGLFANCPGLEEIVIPDTVTELGRNAFEKCTSLKKVTIGNSVTTLGSYAFAGCGKISEVVIPDSVTTIGSHAFGDCINLGSVQLSANLQTMEAYAFENCDQLTSIRIPKSLEKTVMVNCYGPFYGCDNLKEVTFEEGTKIIAQGLLANCPGLEEVTIPETVTEIGSNAFENSKNLKKVVLSKKLKKIGTLVFESCESLTEMDLSDTEVSEIGSMCFESCTSLSTVKLPKHYSEVKRGTFRSCISLESIELPEKVTEIGDAAFRKSGIKTVTIPASVTRIGVYAFAESALESVTVKDAAAYMDASAFEDCQNLLTVDLGKKMSTINYTAFKNCDKLEAITIPDSVSSINTGIFENCDNLKEVKLGTGITVIPEKMCYECGSLEKIVVPYRVTTINKQAFANCPKLTEITVPKNTTKIADDVFSYASRMTMYGVSGSYAETYANEKGITFVENTATASEVTISETELTLRNGESRNLMITITPENFTDDVTWRSTNSNIVSVDANGTVKARAIGTATVQVNAGNASAKCKITVVQPVTSIILNRSSAELEAMDILQLTATAYPTSANNKEVTWESSDPETASVSETGLVTALKKGTVTITATAQDGSGKTASCKITVKNNAYIVTDPVQMESKHPYENNCKDIWIYTYPSDTENLLVTFDSRTSIEEDFDDVLYIYDENDNKIGQYKGTELAGETVTIPGKTVKIKLDTDTAGTDWGFKVTSIKGDGDVEKEDQTLEGTQNYEKAYGDADFALDMHLTKGDGTLSYRSDREDVVTVSDKGVISIKGAGTAHITVTASETRYYKEATAEVTFTVKKGTRTFTPSVKRTIQVGKTAQIQPGTDGTVTYETYNYDIIEVSKTGLVTALSEGEAKVTVTLEEDEYYDAASAELSITVVGEDVKVAPDLSDCTITVLDADNLYADGTAKKPKVEISYEGNIFGEGADYTLSYKNNVNAGTGKIVVTALPDGELDGSAEVSFTIKANVTGNEVEIKDNAFEGSQNKKVTFGDHLTRIGKQAFKNAELEQIYFKGNAPDISADAFENVVATVYVPRDNQSWTETKMQNYGGALSWKYWNPATGETCENLEDASAYVDEYCVYDGIAKTPYVIVQFGNVTLAQGSDYAVSYSNNVNAGTATAVITGMGRYAGTLTCQFAIDKAQTDLGFASLWQYCTVGEQFSNPLYLRRVGGMVTYRSSNDGIASVDPYTGLVTARRAGTVQITATAAEGSNVYGGEDYFMLNVSYAPNSIQASDVNRTYSKKAQSFTIAAYANGAPLTFSSNNKNIKVDNNGRVTVVKNYTGKASIVIQSAATEKYEAAATTITVSVNPTGTSLGSCKNVKGRKAQVRWKKNKLVTGYEVQYSTDRNFISGVKKKTIKKASTTKVTLTGLKKKKTYYVRIRTYRKGGGTTYSSWSKVKKVVIKK